MWKRRLGFHHFAVGPLLALSAWLTPTIQASEPESSPPALASPPAGLPDQPEPPATTAPTASSASAARETPSGAGENSVVRVCSTIRHPHFARPWSTAAPTEGSASGVVIEGKRIL